MRIRKRQVPLPLSALSPVPLSDPLSSRSYLVQLRSTHDDDKAGGPTSSQPSDRPNRPSQPVRPETGGRDSSDSTAAQEEDERKRDFPELLQEEEEEDGGEKKKMRNDSSALATEYPSGSLANSSPSHQAAERWYEGERAFPLKKRRGNLGETAMLDVKDSSRKKMKSAKLGNASTSKKDVRRDDIDGDDDGQFEEGRDQGGGEEKKIVVGIESSGAKKKARGGALMEGSRCSRVNGRGWRCCQQTLVGYSLCEHHLGKGRLRSMTSVRTKSKRPNLSSPSRANELLPEERAPDSPSRAEGAEEDGDEEDDGDIEEEKAAVKKKLKLGMVKARSMSSLLSQATSATATATGTADAPR